MSGGNLIEGVKGKIYKIIVRPDEMYGMEIVALTKRLEVELESAELLRVIRRNRIRKEYIRQPRLSSLETKEGEQIYWIKDV